MFKSLHERQMRDDDRWMFRATLEEVWPHLRAAVFERVQRGEAIADLAGVVTDATEQPGSPDEEALIMGVLTRAELKDAIAESLGDEQSRRWVCHLDRPAPAGCIYVFGVLSGLPNLCIMGPVPLSSMPD